MRRARLAAALAAIPLFLGAFAGAAVADDIYNGLDESIDAVAEQMPLNVGVPGTTSLSVQPGGQKEGDPVQGCNFKANSKEPDKVLRLEVRSSNPEVATVSPEYVTFTSCDDSPQLTVTPQAPGTTTISVGQLENTTGGSFDLTPATFVVNVVAPAPANTAPTVTIAGVTPGASYAVGDVPTATCVVDDAEDGATSFPATLSPVTGAYAGDGIGEQTASCSYTDDGGLTAQSSVTYTIHDPTAPVVTYDLDPVEPNGTNGWYTSDVHLTWTVTEPESPSSLQVAGCEDRVIAADQHATEYSCSATSAGGATEPVSVAIKRDATAPTDLVLSGVPGDHFYGDTPATAPTCTAQDSVSGLASCVVTGFSTAVGTHTLTATATDYAGNTATATHTYTVKAWTIRGFYSPVDMDRLNTVKGGSTVPLKFEVFKGDTELTSTSAVRSFTVRSAQCDGTDPTDEIELVTTGGTSLRYDASGGQFVQNWQTPKGSGACYQVTMTTQDGSTTKAAFKLR